MDSENTFSLNGKGRGQKVLSYVDFFFFFFCTNVKTTAASLEAYINYLICLLEQRTTPLVKRYNNGQTFIVIFPDGTGQVWYPFSSQSN